MEVELKVAQSSQELTLLLTLDFLHHNIDHERPRPQSKTFAAVSSNAALVGINTIVEPNALPVIRSVALSETKGDRSSLDTGTGNTLRLKYIVRKKKRKKTCFYSSPMYPFENKCLKKAFLFHQKHFQ